MAAAATDSSWIPQVEGGKAKVAVGSSLRKYLRQRSGIQERPSKSRVPDHDYFAFKYRFKPHNVDNSKPGVLERPGGEGMWSLTRPNTKGENVTWAGGEVQSKKGELMCVLIYDESVGSFTLERVDTHMTLQHLPAASNGPPIVAPAQHGTNSSQTDGDRALDADIVAQLLGDDEDDADGSDDIDAVPVPTTSKPRRPQPAPAAADGFAELLKSARAPAQPGLGKGVALAQAEAARQKAVKAAKAAKAKAGNGAPRGKKRNSDELVEVEPPAPAPVPVRPVAAPARPPKRRKSSPAPPPPPPPPALSLPTARTLLVAPIPQPPIYSDDEGDMIEVDPDVGGDVMIEVDPDAEQHDQNAEFDAFERELMSDGDGPEGGDDADIFGEGYGDDELSRELDMAFLDDEGDEGDDGDMEQVEYVDDGAYVNGSYTNGHTNGAHVQHAYDDSSTDSESDDD